MDTETALNFLSQHQPMPNDEKLNEMPDLIEKYGEVRRYLEDHPDKQAIPLLLNSFGDGSGFGLYQLVEDAIAPFSAEEVVPHLIEALNSEHRSVRYWSTQVAMLFSSPQLVPSLQKVLEGDDLDGRTAAASALGFIEGKAVDEILQEAWNREPASDIREFIGEVLEDRGLPIAAGQVAVGSTSTVF